MRTNRSMDDLIQRLLIQSKHHPDPQERRRFGYLYLMSKDAKSTYDDIIQEAANIGVRKPSFPGDMIGWLDDDLTDDDDDPKKNNRPPDEGTNKPKPE
jgi:hypothetical protein